MMWWIYETLARIRSLFRKSGLDVDLEEELAAHIEQPRRTFAAEWIPLRRGAKHSSGSAAAMRPGN
jgi:hypothetical protein